MDSELRAKENHVNVQPVSVFFLVVCADSFALNMLCRPNFPAQPFYQPAALGPVTESDEKNLDANQ